MDNFRKLEVPKTNQTTSESSAVAALAAGTTGALVKIGSDGNPADASVTDAQLALDSAKVATLATGGWADLQALRMQAACVARGIPVFTGFFSKSIRDVANNNGSTSVAVDGNGKTPAQDQYFQITSESLILDPHAVNWAFVFRVKSAGTNYTHFGLFKSDDVQQGAFLRIPPTNIFAAWAFTAGNPNGLVTTAVTLDTSTFYDLMLLHDGTTLGIYVDGVRVGQVTGTDMTAMPTAPCRLAAVAVLGAGAATLTDFAFGYMRP